MAGINELIERNESDELFDHEKYVEANRRQAAINQYDLGLRELAKLIAAQELNNAALRGRLERLERDYKGYHEAYWGLAEKLQKLAKKKSEKVIEVRQWVEGPEVMRLVAMHNILAFRNNNHLVTQPQEDEDEIAENTAQLAKELKSHMETTR